MKVNCRIARRTTIVLLLTLMSVAVAEAQRTELKPGWNIFSPEEDVEMGGEVSREAEQQLDLIEVRELEEYLNRLGHRLADQAPGAEYPYRFKLVNDKTINAFALPGGFIYVNRGIIEAADREAELAGVIGHEIGHVALRHGTNQASKAYLAEAPLAILGGVFGGGGVASVLTQLGIGFTANSVFMKFSRDAERQADLLGAQILFDAGYDPTGMTEFFEKMEADGGARGAEFFSSHPNPGNRVRDVGEEIDRLGRSARGYRDNFSDFRRVKARLSEIPEPSPRDRSDRTTRREDPSTSRPDRPSTQFQRFESRELRFFYPGNWRVHEGQNSLTVAPDRGIVGRDGGLAYGMIVSMLEPRTDRRGRVSLESATDQLIENLRRSNPGTRIRQGYRRGRISGRAALSVVMEGDSPVQGAERNWLLTTFGPGNRLYYFIAVAPESEFRDYERTFESILDSIRLR